MSKKEISKGKKASEIHKKRKWFDAYEREIKVFVYGMVSIAYWLIPLVSEKKIKMN